MPVGVDVARDGAATGEAGVSVLRGCGLGVGVVEPGLPAAVVGAVSTSVGGGSVGAVEPSGLAEATGDGVGRAVGVAGTLLGVAVTPAEVGLAVRTAVGCTGVGVSFGTGDGVVGAVAVACGVDVGVAAKTGVAMPPASGASAIRMTRCGQTPMATRRTSVWVSTAQP